MDLYIYLPRGYKVPRDEIEKLIEGVLGDSGEVTGGGRGAFGQNIDVEFFDDELVPAFMLEIRRALVDFGVPAESELVRWRAVIADQQTDRALKPFVVKNVSVLDVHDRGNIDSCSGL